MLHFKNVVKNLKKWFLKCNDDLSLKNNYKFYLVTFVRKNVTKIITITKVIFCDISKMSQINNLDALFSHYESFR